MKWDGRGLPPALKAHGLLLALQFLPLVVYIPYSLNIILTAALTVYVGSWRSVKKAAPAESMTSHDAMRFPLVGSAVLFGLFLMFKVLPKHLVNMLLATYITAIGGVVVVQTALPFVEPLFPPRLRERTIRLPTIPKIPYLLAEPLALNPSVPEAALVAPALALGIWYFFTKKFIANNLLGLAFSIQGIEHLSLGSVQTAGILLVGLFFYDIFWVFCTPVMVSVAKNFEAPIKLLFPRAALKAGAVNNFAMLGLGDIVIPGLFVALLLRYDVDNKCKTRYFQTVFWGYVGGLGTTILVMNVFKAAQPALLYIVPAVLGSVALHAALKRETKKVFNYEEAQAVPEQGAKEGGVVAVAPAPVVAVAPAPAGAAVEVKKVK